MNSPRKKKRTKPVTLRDLEIIMAALTAARALLDRIDNMTTDQFRDGGERTEREILRAALEQVGI